MIKGVKIVELLTHGDDRGYFREIFRFATQFDGIPIGQLSHSNVTQGVVKAWHGHKYQSQWNYVACGQAIAALYDDRPDSESYMQTMEFHTGEETPPIAYFFPPGVLNGYKCTKGPMQIIYVTSGTYDLEDEVRVPLDVEKYRLASLMT